MAEFYKLARLSDQERQSMPLETLVRAFYRATMRRKIVAGMDPPESIEKVASRNATAYLSELTRRLMAMWATENERLVSEGQQWSHRVESRLRPGLEFRA